MSQTVSWGSLSRRFVLAAILLKLSKHTALLVSLLILGKAAGRYDFGGPTLLGLAIVAVFLHWGARALQQRVPDENFPHQEPR